MQKTKLKSKYHHFNTPGHAHVLTFSCYRNRKFLNYNRSRGNLRDSINRARKIHRFDIWAYVFMPEHVHLLIFPYEGSYSITDILKSIKLPVAKRAIKYLRANNPGILKFMVTGLNQPRFRFWQDGGGYDRNVNNHDELVNIVEYIHNNPVRRSLVVTPEQWYWSSARHWLLGKEGPISIDRRSFPI